MHPSTSLAAALSTLAAACLASATASAAPPAPRSPKTARIVKAHSCVKPAVEVAAGAETATFALADCKGTALPAGVEELSILARPGTAAKPKERVVVAAREKGDADVAPGIRRIDGRLVERLQLVVDRFRGEGHAPRVELVSGYRPKSTGSFHSTGRALDFKLEGVKNEDVVAFCKTLPDTGCGYYPNSLFVHIDARERGAGHVSWIDTSRPGEAPHYVSSWPPASPEELAPSAPPPALSPTPSLSLSLPALPAEDHSAPAETSPPKRRPAGPPGF